MEVAELINMNLPQTLPIIKCPDDYNKLIKHFFFVWKTKFIEFF